MDDVVFAAVLISTWDS